MSEPLRSATRVSPPGSTHDDLPVTTNGRRSTWRGRHAVLAQGRADREVDQGLADEVVRSRLQARAALLQLRPCVARGPMVMP